ncbi:MAG: S9 family peptidase [Gemmatimonadetes bacterium]|nr:S9 family peptidase [Gemmatimonadota bacterium]
MNRSIALGGALAAMLLLAGSGLARAQGGISAEQAAGMRVLSNVAVSPDGRWVLYTVTTADLKASTTNSDLWLVAATGGDPIRLTNGKTVDDQGQWSPDGKWIAFVSTRDGKPQLYRISPFGGEATKLTDSKAGVRSFAWAPDGRQIAFVAGRDPTPDEERRQREKDDAIVVDEGFIPTRLNLLDLGTEKAAELVKADAQIGSIAWSPNGRAIAYVTTPTPKADDARFSDVQVVDVASGTSRKVLESPGPDNNPSWSPDGAWIALSTRGPKAVSISQSRLVVVPAAGGEPRRIGGDFLYEAGPTTWAPDGKSLYFWSAVRTRSELFQVSLAGGTPKQVSDLQGSLGLFGGGAPSISKDGMTVAFQRSTIEAPDEVYLARLEAPWRHTKLTSLHPEIASASVGKGEVVRWKGKDGLEVEGIVVYPVGYQPGRRYPTVAIIHGGPSGVWNESFPANWYNSAQVYAGQGWVAFLPNPRGSSGYGEKFLAANYRDWGNGDYHDIQTGLDHLIRRGIADSTKLAQGGWSYGGYMTAWTLTQTNRFKAVMVGAGLTNMYSMYSTNDLQMVLEEYFGAEPWDDETAYRRASAMMHIKQARTPTLIIHGKEDTRVPIGQAQELYMGLKKNEVPVELVFYPREPHGLQEPRHAADKIQREYDFFAKYVLGLAPKERPELVP